MEIIGESVFHKKYETGVIIAQSEKQVTVKFNDCEQKFLYPAAFEKFLVFVDSTLQEHVIKEIEIKSQKKAAQIEKQAVAIHKDPPIQKKKKTRVERPNIAFKCNYCDGGKSTSSIGFHGICSDKMIRYNIEVERRTWCCSEDCSCLYYLYGDLTRAELEEE